jgi:hypothetical protein
VSASFWHFHNSFHGWAVRSSGHNIFEAIKAALFGSSNAAVVHVWASGCIITVDSEVSATSVSVRFSTSALQSASHNQNQTCSLIRTIYVMLALTAPREFFDQRICPYIHTHMFFYFLGCSLFDGARQG